MPIQEDFCKGDKKPIGKIALDDGENFHWIWPSQGQTRLMQSENMIVFGAWHVYQFVPHKRY
jgi:hypothetical protein